MPRLTCRRCRKPIGPDQATRFSGFCLTALEHLWQMLGVDTDAA